MAGLRKDKEANDLFMGILTSDKNPIKILRRMSEAGVLGQFIPEFGWITAQMQYDMYHVYTTDEHTIRAIGILFELENSEPKEEFAVVYEAVKKIHSRKALYAAMLLHDIGKGKKGKHEEVGSKIAFKLCSRLGLSEEETETAAWLVLHHLTMNRTAFKRDIYDPETIEDFVAKVQSPERLRLLLAITYADTCAVVPNVWNNWKSSMLKHLYYRAEELMTGDLNGINREERIKQAEEATKPLTISFDVDTKRSVTDVTICTADCSGLFSKIAGAMAVSGASIVDAKILTLANGMALDVFSIHDAALGEKPYEGQKKLERLKREIENALDDSENLKEKIQKKSKELTSKSRSRVFEVEKRVLIDNEVSKTYTLIEINGKDRVGFLYDVTSTFTDLQLQISSAHISTYGNRVIDVFYVKDSSGMKITHKQKLKQIHDVLMSII